MPWERLFDEYNRELFGRLMNDPGFVLVLATVLGICAIALIGKILCPGGR